MPNFSQSLELQQPTFHQCPQLSSEPKTPPQFQRPGLPVVVEFAHISGQKWEVNPQKTFRNVKECHFPSDLSTKIGMDMDG